MAYSSDEKRVTNSVIAGKSLIAVLPFIISPYPGLNGASKIDQASQNMEELQVLQMCRSMLRDSSKHVRAANSLMNRVFAYSLTFIGEVIIYSFEDSYTWKDALLNVGLGIGFTEAQIFTQPSGSVKAWEGYNRRYPGNETSMMNNWFLVPTFRGVGIGTYF